MIIPKITTESEIESPDDWYLFGKQILSAAFPSEPLLATIRRLSRRVDLQVEVPGCSVDDAVTMLNEGAGEVLISVDRFSEFAEAIPPSRLRVVADFNGDEWHALESLGTHWLIKCRELRDENLNALPGWARNGTVQVDSDVNLTPQQLARLHQANIDGVIDPLHADRDQYLVDSLSLMLRSDRPDGLWPTLVTDELGTALGLAYSNCDSLQQTIETRTGVYWSRSRDELWVKGKSSGATQELLGIALDCDSDCLRFRVRQQLPGFCHRETYTCFGAERNIQAVITRLQERILGADKASFTRKLANDAPMLQTKLLEEAKELAEATSPDDIAWEAADVLYFSLVKLVYSGVCLDEVYGELARRMHRIVRRPNKLEKSKE